MPDDMQKTPKRRDLLKLVGLAPAAAAAVVAGAAPAKADAAAPEAADGYRESAHIRKYYAAARF
jgi:nitrous oxide reductase